LGRAVAFGRIEYRAKSAEGKVRHPFFKASLVLGMLAAAYFLFQNFVFG
jgi:hypothetical protein